mgnify:CR=1 FL=1
MIYGYLVILLIYLLLFFFSRRENIAPYRGEMKKNSYPGETLFLKAAVLCIRRKNILEGKYGGKRRRYQAQMRRSRLGGSLKLLHPELSEKYQLQAFYVRRCSRVLLLVLAGDLLSLGAAWSAQDSKYLREEGYIERKPYGKGDIEVSLSAQIEGEEPEEIRYIVAERQYREEETRRLFREAAALLSTEILGNNESPERVTEDLELIDSLEGYPFQIEWETDCYSLVHPDGTVWNEELEAAEIVMLTACFRYGELEYEEVFPIRIQPAVLTKQELLLKRIEQSLEERNQASREEGAFILPEKIGSQNVIWKEVIQDGSGFLFLLMCIAAVFLFRAGNGEVERRLAERDRELLLDYPEIVHRLALYMGAGMTIRGAFEKMGEDYKKQKPSRGKRYVYEEIVLLRHELQSGVSEAEAYAHLGKRCRLQPYMKLATLLSQNLRKGSNDLLSMLRQEAAGAFEGRKNNAKKAGEEAGTKLLLPMMMMLCIVMVIIMIPAYFTI